jgi:hypothetical protein
MITFQNFFQNTVAQFSRAALPGHEPDFVSDSGSAYWDMGDHVVRSSDHWVGQGDCTSQASCIWSYAEYLSDGEWATGACLYSEFRRRHKIPVMIGLQDADRDLARHMLAHGGAVDDRATRVPGQALPLWARRVSRRSQGLPAPAVALFAKDPAIHYIICAPVNTLEKIVSGTDKLHVGYRWSGAED